MDTPNDTEKSTEREELLVDNSSANITDGKKKRRPFSWPKRWAVLVAMALVFGVIAGGTMFGVNYIGGRLYTQSQITQTATVPAAPQETQEQSGASVKQVAKDAMPSVVTISTMSVEEMRTFFGMPMQYQVQGAGTGVIVGKNDSELLIATNNHVIEGATELSVGFIDQSTVAGAVKGSDVNNDLAVVAVKLADISTDTMQKIKIATVGDSDALELGDQVVAIGNALGYGQSVTSGYVSALNRTLTLTDESGATITSSGLIQTDAAINPGNSGGALLNMKGELIGINEAKTESTPSGGSVDNIGFAIPIDKAESSLQELMNLPTREKVDASEASYLGIEGENVSAELTELYGIPAGVVVASVEENGPAAKAGLQKGDIITELDGRTITNMQQLQDTLQYYAAGETVPFTIQRASNGQYAAQTLQVTLGSAQAEKS